MLILTNTALLLTMVMYCHTKGIKTSQLRKVLKVFVKVNVFNFHLCVLLETLPHVIQDNLRLKLSLFSCVSFPLTKAAF